VAHEVEVGDAREGLEHPRLFIAVAESPAAARSSCYPLALESTHDALRQHFQIEEFLDISLTEKLHEILVRVGRLVIEMGPVNGETHGLLTGRVDAIKEHANEQTRGQASLVSRIISVRLRFKAELDTKNTTHAISQEVDTAAAMSVRYVHKEFVKEDIVDMILAEALGHDTDELDGRKRVEEGDCLGDTGEQVGDHELCLA
jgi:hypothetical protein